MVATPAPSRKVEGEPKLDAEERAWDQALDNSYYPARIARLRASVKLLLNVDDQLSLLQAIDVLEQRFRDDGPTAVLLKRRLPELEFRSKELHYREKLRALTGRAVSDGKKGGRPPGKKEWMRGLEMLVRSGLSREEILKLLTNCDKVSSLVRHDGFPFEISEESSVDGCFWYAAHGNSDDARQKSRKAILTDLSRAEKTVRSGQTVPQ